jgi:hypothetical protein
MQRNYEYPQFSKCYRGGSGSIQGHFFFLFLARKLTLEQAFSE